MPITAKKSVLLLPVMLICLCLAAQSYVPQRGDKRFRIKPSVPMQAYGFALSDVRLLPSPFRHAMEMDAAYLLTIDIHRLMHRFYEYAGLPTHGDVYGGWESEGLSGHTMGHYLSACSMMFASTGDRRFRDRVDTLVGELARCQLARGTGYLGAIPKEDSIFGKLARGQIKTSGFDLNGGWSPWYTVHKVMAGLTDAYLYFGNTKALQVVVKMADWTEHTLSGLNEDQLQKMLACEFGGMNEILVNIYSITGNPKYLALSYKFQHKAILDPLAAGLDPLAGKHSNTQIPKILGCVRRYELKGDAADRRIAENFWNIVVKHHSYVIGGNSDHEYLADPDKLSDYLSESTCESCNTYNMLKLTRHLFCLQPSSTLGDYYERALYNHILASQNPQDGMMCYFVPLRMGAKKQFSDSFNTFTCCVGSGMENHSKYAESIYYEGPDSSLLINLFIPSVLNWTSRHMMVEQQTDFPRSDTVLFTIKSQKPAFFKIQIRIPWWAGSALQLRVNGRAIAYTKQANGYAGIERPWRNGDKISMVLPMHLYYESMPDNPNRVAFLYGPLVLAGDLGQTPVTDFHKVPVMLTGDKDISHWLKPAADRPLTFRTDGIGRPFDVTFRPFYQHYDNAYSVYWDFFSNADWAKREADYEAEQNRVHDIETRTVDLLRVGEMQPERDHHFMGENTYVGDEQDRKSRNAHTEGWFSFTLKVDTARPNSLLVTYWGGDNGRIHDILIDGVLLVTQELHHEHPNKFFDLEYPLDDSLVRGKSSITIRFQAHTGKTTGDIYGCRVIRK